MKKITCTFLVLILVLSMLPSMISSADHDGIEFEDDSDRIAVDGTNILWDYQQYIAKSFPGLFGGALADALNPYQVDSAPDVVGDTVNFWIQWGNDLNDFGDYWKSVPATCRAVGTYCYVYVEDAEWTTGNGHIDQAAVDQVMNTFDNTIYPIETANFRALPDYKGQTKVTIFLTDIVDGWGTGDPVQTTYIAGYFHSLNYTTDTYSNDRHLINIDTYPGVYYNGSVYLDDALGTVAHEYQHLLHFWSDPDETTWLNEGQSDYAEFLTLGQLAQSHLFYFYMIHSPCLEIWDSGDVSTLESYGASLSYMMYLYENFGGSALMTAIHNDSLNGRSSIDAQVAGATFEQIYRDWTLANLLDDPTLVGPNSGAALGFTSFDIGSLDTNGATVLAYFLYMSTYIVNWDWGPYPYLDDVLGDIVAYPSPDYGYWGDTQYQLDANYFVYEANGSPSIFTLDFLGNGMNSAMFQLQQPSVGALEWYSQMGNGFYDGADHTLTYTFDFTLTTAPQLVVDTWVDIEYGWDFGYVEASTDGGSTWLQLDDTGSYMSNYRDPSAYVGEAGAYAFTGESLGWLYGATFDLSTYAASSNVMIRFRYVTDDGYAPWGWIVDNIRVSDGATVIMDGSDASDSTWTPVGWVHTDTISMLDWQVYVVGIPYSGAPTIYDIYPVNISPMSGDGSISIPGLGSYYSEFVIVPSMVTDEGIGGSFLYLHRGYTVPVGGPTVAGTYVLFFNAQSQVLELLNNARYLYELAEENGEDVSGLDALFDSVNDDVSQANSGVNWVFRAGKLTHAINTLNEIISRLTN